jgi:hypothetical protein
MRLLHWLTHPQEAENIALVATMICVAVAGQGAVWLPNKTPRVTTALALFALNWALLLLYYLPGPPQNEILSAFSGFVLIYAGTLLLREGEEGGSEGRGRSVRWFDKLPVHLLRITILGFGTYVLARRLFHFEYGYGTLALALWGTLLTVLGYFSIWQGVSALYRGQAERRRVAWMLGGLLLVYSACECGYLVWYAREYWPHYRRYLALTLSATAPDFEQPLPFMPQPDWPEREKWAALRSRPDWAQSQDLLSLKVEPRLPQMWVALEHAFSVLKVILTATFLSLIWRRSLRRAPLESEPSPSRL